MFIALLLLAVTAGAFLVTQRLRSGDRGEATANQLSPIPARPAPPVRMLPEISPGASASGQLGSDDPTRAGGQYEDGFRLRGNAGDRFELRLSSSDFDTMLRVSGPGLSAANDDDPQGSGHDSRLVVTVPGTGVYTVTVSSAQPRETGAYDLEVERLEAPVTPAGDVVTVDHGLAGRLTGEWHAPGDPDCDNPALNEVSDDMLTSVIGKDSYRHRIVSAEGDVVRTTLLEGGPAGRSFAFRLSPDRDSYLIEGETWLRC